MLFGCNHILFSFDNNLKVFNLFIVFLMMHITIGRNYVNARNHAICDSHVDHNNNNVDHHQHVSYRQKQEQVIEESEPPFLEYFMEHEVTEKEAKEIINQIKADELEKPSKPWCEKCTSTIRNYCNGPSFLRDHCCCDQRHEKEKLPFIPHSCYAGESQCHPSDFVKNLCSRYDELRECCCDAALKKVYKSMYSSSNSQSNVKVLVIPLIMLVRLSCWL